MQYGFQDIDRYCDNCGAYLNDQDGFDDGDDNWTCTECRQENNTIDMAPPDFCEYENMDEEDDADDARFWMFMNQMGMFSP